ncbi:fimbria/pilus outer membrane usher protein [Xanthobacteraceae bacterium A53D]
MPLALAWLALLCLILPARASPTMLNDQQLVADTRRHDLQLEVFINGVTTGLVGAFQRNLDGTIAVTPEEWTEVGLKPHPAAIGPDGLVLIDRLPGVSYAYDDACQCLQVTTTDAYRVPRVLDAGPAQKPGGAAAAGDFGGFLNYTLFANLQNQGSFTFPAFQGLSGTFDGVLFSPFGNLNQSFIATTDATFGLPEVIRLSSSWSYFDPASLTSYVAGDLISGGLMWTRPVRLGGLQVQRNFSLRPDLVTMPVPSLSGSAAVPSTVEVQTNGTRTFSGDVLPGPFQITNLPIMSGPGTARLIVRDASGRETVTDVPYFTSPQLLAPGLLDFSLEAGYARNYFGVYSNVYDNRLMASVTGRYGLNANLTVEGHAEIGGGLYNAGAGAVFTLGAWGLASLSAAGSMYDGQMGVQLSGAVEMPIGNWRLYLRSQRTFGSYNDIASVTADMNLESEIIYGSFINLSAAVPRAIDQLSLSIPLFDASTLGISLTNYEQSGGNSYQLASLTYSRPLFEGTMFANVFADITGSGNYGAFVGYSMPIGAQTSASASAYAGTGGGRLVAEAARSEDLAPGSYGWRAMAATGSQTYLGAAGSYRSAYGRAEVGVQQMDDATGVTATVQGAIVAAGGGVFLTNQIDDSFAVVNAGAPGIAVVSQNRPVGVTDGSGRLLVTGLRRFQESVVAIDPSNLPLGAEVPETHRAITAGVRSGVVIDFGARATSDAALVIFVDAQGKPLPLGSRIVMSGDAQTVGYDGQAYLRGLQPQNTLDIQRTDGGTCQASFNFAPRAGEQVKIEGVVCQ